MTKAPIDLPAAAFEKKLEVVRAALKAGTHVDTQDGSGRTALHYAAMRNQPELFELLVKRGARVDIADGYGKLPLHFAAEQGVDKLLARLIELGPNTLDACERCDQTPLHKAVAYKRDRCVELLLAAGAGRTIKDAFQRLPIDYATKARIKKLFEDPTAPPEPKKRPPKLQPDPKPAAPPAINGKAAPLVSIDAWKKASRAKRAALGKALAAKLGLEWSVAKVSSGTHALLVLEHGPSALRLVVVPGGGTVLGLRPSDLRVLSKLDLGDELEESVRASVAPVATTVAPFLCAQTPLLGGQLAALGINVPRPTSDEAVVMFTNKQVVAAAKHKKLRAPTHVEWEWIARSFGIDSLIGASTPAQVEAACDVLSDGVYDRASRRYAAKATGIWGHQLGEWVSEKPDASPTLATADIAQTYPWQNEHELAAAFAGMRPEKPAGAVALRLVCSLPKL